MLNIGIAYFEPASGLGGADSPSVITMKETINTATDERGVSPVIGVILMVAITVILAAVIGSFVLGIGGDIEAAPQASLSLNSSNHLVHQGGDTLVKNEVNFTVDGSDISPTLNGDLEPGGTWNISGAVSDGETVRIIHTPSGNIIATLEA